MKERFRISLTRFEWGLWLTSIAVVAGTYIGFQSGDMLSLLASLIGVTALIFVAKGYVLGQVLNALPASVRELIGAPSVPLLSISAVTTLWTASRGISAVRGGIENIYRASATDGFFARRIRSIFSTLFFILLITAAASVMLFGNLLLRLIPADFLMKFPVDLSRIISVLRTPFFIVFMTVVFTAVYISVASRSPSVSSAVFTHLPGALLSSSGWVLFSAGYALYIRHFPRASAVYGSLAAACLIMLWLYFCMVILLFGAVFNKQRLSSGRNRR